MNKSILKTLVAACLALLAILPTRAAGDYSPDTLLILGGTGNPPFEYADEDGEPIGFNVELFHRMMKRIKRPYKLELRPWKDTYEAIQNGEADIVMGLVYTTKRAETIKFGRATAFINLRWVVLKTSDFYGEEDLMDKRIACRNSGFANVQLMQDRDDYKIVPTESNEKAFEMLFDGNCDAVLCDEIIAHYLCNLNSEYKGKVRILTSHFINSEYRMAGNWQSDKILEELEVALNELKQNKQYDELYTKWFNPELEQEAKLNNFYIAVIVLVVIVVIGFLVIWVFNRKLHTSTRHIRTLNNRLNSQLKTLQKQNEELKHAQVKADAGAKAMETLFSTVTHELRTPMNSIQGFTQLLADPDLTGEDRVYMEMQVKKSTKELTDLINSMIQLAELESGTVTIRREFFCLNDVIESTLLLYKSLNDNPEIEIVGDFPPNKIWVELDKKLTGQCIEHFMSNAMKFTKKGKITLGFGLKGDGVQIYVADTGIGMTREQIRSIFKRFSQTDAYTPGLGLGMHLATSIIKNSKGHIETISEPHKGTTFKTFVPCKTIIENEH